MLPHRFRWALLLAASCGFYMSFIPVYILILFITIAIDYFAAIRIERTTGKRKKAWLVWSIISTCVVLFVFKYYNFFNINVHYAAHFLGLNYPVPLMKIILPLGLSFHTFQSLSYVIEVYRGNQKAEHHFGIYALYVMFYPQLVAGPIERPQNLLHQFREKHFFEYRRVTDGLKLIAWGMFKKVVIADRLGLIVDPVYADPAGHNGVNFLVAAVAFTFQLYCDFSAYSDIAIGAAQIMGFKLMENFNRPNHAHSISEFYKRWHISLTTWLKDYIYVPLGGNRVSVPRWYFNIFFTFFISGLWHGAAWTYVIWGSLNGIFILLGIATKPFRTRVVQTIGLDRAPKVHGAVQLFITFCLVGFSRIFFRANNAEDAFYIIRHLFDGVGDFLKNVASNLGSLGSGAALLQPIFMTQTKTDFFITVAVVCLLETFHAIQRHQRIRHMLSERPAWFRWSVYYAFMIGILCFGVFNSSRFIYFQF